MSAGVGQTVMPAASMAAILSAALPLPPGDDGSGVAHAAAGGRGLAGDETDHRLLHVLLDIGGGSLFGVAADFADHDDGVRVGIFVEERDGVGEGGADDGVAADADAGGLADAEVGQLADRFIGQRAGARDDADVASQVNVRRA